ncbi:MAG: 16S rRNA (guanine(527)-N(7))-methyltransferase RsmG [Thermodesulfobacteriota bacterium]
MSALGDRASRGGGRSRDRGPAAAVPDRAALAAIFKAGGLELTETALDRFWNFHQLLRARNAEADLTRIHSFESLVWRHYVDCALVTRFLDPPSPLLDIGTGAGFPGLPLKIMRPDLEVILAESRGRKLEFLEEAIETLGLTGVEVYPHKVTARFDRPVRAVITRDLEAMARTLGRAAGFLPRGGLAIFMKGPAADEELAEARAAHALDFELQADTAYTLGRTGHRRRLIVFERISGPERPARVATAPPDKEIASRHNPHFKTWVKLLDGRGVKKLGLGLFSGSKQVREVLRDFPDRAQALLLRGGEETPAAWAPAVETYRLRPELFRELDLFGTGSPLLVALAPEMPWWEEAGSVEGFTLFIPFQDPANVGAVIRSAAAFGTARVVLLKEAAHPFHPRGLRAAGPTVFRVPLQRGPSLSDLKDGDPPLIALGARGLDPAAFTFPPRFGLVPGLEGPGLPENLRRLTTLTIPMQNGVESLNAATATAIALYQWRRKLQ